MSRYYQPSGKYSLITIVYLVGANLTLIPLFSFIYALIIFHNSWSVFNPVFLLIFMLLVGLTLGYMIEWGRVRDEWIAMQMAFFTVVWALYLHWCFWVEYAIAAPRFQGADASEHTWYSLMLDPVSLWKLILLILDFNVVGSAGHPLATKVMRVLFWLFEGAFSIGFITFLAKGNSRKPYDEKDGKWLQEKELGAFEDISGKEEFKSALERGDFSLIKKLQRSTGENVNHLFLKVYFKDDTYYLSILTKTRSKKGEGFLKFHEEVWIPPILIDKATADYLLAIHGQQFPIEPSSQESPADDALDTSYEEIETGNEQRESGHTQERTGKYRYKCRPGYGSKELLIEFVDGNSLNEILALFLAATRSIYPELGERHYIAELDETHSLWVHTSIGEFEFNEEKPFVFLFGENNQEGIKKLDRLLEKSNEFIKVEVNPEDYETLPADHSTPACHFSFNGSAISIDIEESFHQDSFLNIVSSIPGLKIIESKNVYQSFGPIETVDEYKTTRGTITISMVLEGMVTGYTIYSDDTNLMTLIVNQMKQSGEYRQTK